MLHYIVSPYVCDVALKCFRALETGGAVGKQGALENGDRDTVGERRIGARWTRFLFRSIPICRGGIPFYSNTPGWAVLRRGAASGHIL
jgi:hypothetical protein